MEFLGRTGFYYAPADYFVCRQAGVLVVTSPLIQNPVVDGDAIVEIEHLPMLEDYSDAGFVQYRINGKEWTHVSNFTLNGYDGRVTSYTSTFNRLFNFVNKEQRQISRKKCIYEKCFGIPRKTRI